MFAPLVLFWLCLGYLVYDDLSRKRRRPDQEGLLSQVTFILSKVAFWLAVVYLVSNELSLVYCKGQTGNHQDENRRAKSLLQFYPTPCLALPNL